MIEGKIYMRSSTKQSKRPPGRPRKFDAEQKLQDAMLVFWSKGFSGTSLDDLGNAMQLSRPSIYNAFGGKQEIYHAALSAYMALFDANLNKNIGRSEDLMDGIHAFFDEAIELYCSGNPALGCLLACTAPSEALSNEVVRKDLSQMINQIDNQILASIRAVLENSGAELMNDASVVASMLQSVLHSTAIRARAGANKSDLKKFAREAVSIIVR